MVNNSANYSPFAGTMLLNSADAAAGIGDVAPVAGDDVQVQVKDGLAGSGAGVYADVVTVRAVPGIKDLLDRESQFV